VGHPFAVHECASTGALPQRLAFRTVSPDDSGSPVHAFVSLIHWSARCGAATLGCKAEFTAYLWPVHGHGPIRTLCQYRNPQIRCLCEPCIWWTNKSERCCRLTKWKGIIVGASDSSSWVKAVTVIGVLSVISPTWAVVDSMASCSWKPRISPVPWGPESSGDR
jgi:hypothetical protein